MEENKYEIGDFIIDVKTSLKGTVYEIMLINNNKYYLRHVNTHKRGYHHFPVSKSFVDEVFLPYNYTAKILYSKE